MIEHVESDSVLLYTEDEKGKSEEVIISVGDLINLLE